MINWIDLIFNPHISIQFEPEKIFRIYLVVLRNRFGYLIDNIRESDIWMRVAYGFRMGTDIRLFKF